MVAILLLASAARLWFLTAGVPHAVGIDEPQVVDRALRILHTGEWNTHRFDYPTLVIYLQAGVAIVRFLWGAIGGEWGSLDGFSIGAVYAAGRFTTAALGVATVWLTWRLARDLSGRAVALLAAALLAVRPLHVRESHFVLTDVPMTLLTTLALWLTVRASRQRSLVAYTLAGAACGLAAAAKYNGGLVLVAPAVTWWLRERGSVDRGRKALTIVAAAAVAFLVAAPYTLLDMPSFLDGFAAQFSRFAAASNGGEPAWLTYVKHLSPDGARWSVPVALAAAGLVLWRTRSRAAWMPILAFAALYFYALASHTPVFGRYALPLVPVLCILMSIGIVEALTALMRLPALSRPAVRFALCAVAVLAVLSSDCIQTVKWLEGLRRPDTRSMAADWLVSSVPRGTRVAVENSGPTYLRDAGFQAVTSELMLEHPVDWYRQRADYLIISATDLSAYQDYLSAGPTVLQVTPTPQRWGPPIRIVALRRAQP